MTSTVTILINRVERLLAKMEQVQNSDAYKAIWISAVIHGEAYIGETWSEEIKAVQKALIAINKEQECLK